MCDLKEVFTPGELRMLSKERREILQKYGRLLVLTTPSILNIIKKDKKVARKLKGLLGPEYKRLTR